MGKYFTIGELEHSFTADKHHIDNRIPTDEIRANAEALIENILDPLRQEWGKPLIVNSGYRCPELNANPEIKGAKNSQHMKGEAADLRTALPYDLASLAVNLELPFDQLGISNHFIHISYKRNGGNRGQIFYYKGYYKQRL